MDKNASKTIYLRDYAPPPYQVEAIELEFDLDETVTTVRSHLRLRRNPANPEPDLRLDGQELTLDALSLDGRPLDPDEYRLEEEALIVPGVPEHFTLEVTTRIHPAQNTALEGLYRSGGNFCTQCEAEGFRRITFFPDRPDVMTVFTTTLIADAAQYPVLLSNGNRVEQGVLPGGRHFARWHDPFPKPCYLFALVAGDLLCSRDTFTTHSGREVVLEIYVRAPDLDKTEHAMRSLKKAMRWDEQTYGREYDLDRYMIVAVSDFNMGAMENKGLNIFNAAYVLARPDTATDNDFVNIEGVIGHEYFHNWSGNRVTCRDWFQLSLKEGFTVFRDEQFTGDMNSPSVKRIEDVRVLRTHQFREDGGPLAHPVRPASYQEINNFYTLTVYNKGAEVVRMLHTLLGPKAFREGTDLYFSRHDGQAATTDDFVKALEDVAGRDLGLFKRWYEQAGTPTIQVARHYDRQTRTYRLTLRQSCPPTPDQPHKAPFHIPVTVGLLDPQGRDLPLQLTGEPAAMGTQRVLELRESEQSFTFVNLDQEPVPSLLRGFSAPVRLDIERDDAELAFLMGHDSDPFNRWDAGQQLAVRVMLRLMSQEGEWTVPEGLAQAFALTLEQPQADPALVAEALTLPAEEYVAEFLDPVDPQAVHEARQFLRRGLARIHRARLIARYEVLADKEAYRLDAAAMGRRRLRNLCLGYLMELGEEELVQQAVVQYRQANNMTDGMAALLALVHTGAAPAAEALEDFYRRWREEPLVIDKWFALQATSPQFDTLERVRGLTAHPDFNLKNPNRVRSLIGAFCARNTVRFHAPDGGGYAFLADHVLQLDAVNAQIAARLLTPLTQWRRYEPVRRERMREQLQRVAAAPKLSKDVGEVVGKSLTA